MDGSGPSTPYSPLDALYPAPQLPAADVADLDAWLDAWGRQSAQSHGQSVLSSAISTAAASQEPSPSADLLGLSSPDDGSYGHNSNNANTNRHRRPPTPAPRGMSASITPDPDSRRSSRTRANFSPAAIKVLRDWFLAHEAHPFAQNSDLEMLESATGLKKKQILMWLANTRRRHISAPNSGMSTPISERGGGFGAIMGGTTSSGAAAAAAGTAAAPRDMPARRATPSPWEGMHPLERWKNSPPEHEAANATAIAQAVCASDAYLGTEGDLGEAGYIRMRRSRSHGKSSSASSFETSNSSRGSSSDAHSADSRDSLRLKDRLRNPGARRRRMANRRRNHGHQHGAKGGARTTTLAAPQHIYQCTFCPETYKTKYDWQRHEKSMHLSLDQWVCSPLGPTVAVTEADNDQNMSCVYCGMDNPDEQHLQGHNHLMCLEKEVRERTFYRKDHLHQHLRLVHKTQFLPAMDSWKVTTEQLHSRCGFCDQTMNTWTARLNHIAAHFKAGTTMASWKGNWGFEPTVLEMLENAMPPYLIHYERNTPLPLNVALLDIPDSGGDFSPTSSYELIKSELRHYVEGNAPYEAMGMRGKFYSDDFLHYESCCIIFGSEATTAQHPGVISSTTINNIGTTQARSWFKDLLLLSHPDITQQAKLQPLNWVSKARLSHLRIHGKMSIFESCHLEAMLRHYVASQAANDPAGLLPTDEELRQQANTIVDSIEATSGRPAERFADFIKTLINSSATWLDPFRERCLLDPPSLLALPPLSPTTAPDFLTTMPPAATDAQYHPFTLSQFAQGTCSSMGNLHYNDSDFANGDSTTSAMGAAHPSVDPPMPLSAITAMGSTKMPFSRSEQAPAPSTYYILGIVDTPQLEFGSIPGQQKSTAAQAGDGRSLATEGQRQPLQSPPSRWLQAQHNPIANNPKALLPMTVTAPDPGADPAALRFHDTGDGNHLFDNHTSYLNDAPNLQPDWVSSGLDTVASITPPSPSAAPNTTTTENGTNTSTASMTTAVGAAPSTSVNSDGLAPLSGMQGGFQVPIGWQELGFRHLTKELYRFVAMCMSPNNPNRHVPTDEELQYQARWVDYDDDDPWNQTPADNPEWLMEFKKLVGIPCDP